MTFTTCNFITKDAYQSIKKKRNDAKLGCEMVMRKILIFKDNRYRVSFQQSGAKNNKQLFLHCLPRINKFVKKNN